MKHVSDTRRRKAQQASRSKASDQAQAHEPTGSLPLILFNPLSGRHHHVGAEPSVSHAKKNLDNDKIEEIARDDGAPTMYVAEQVKREESGSRHSQHKKQKRPLGQRVRQHRGDSAREIANVPEEKAHGDEGEGLEDEAAAVLVYGEDLDREDGEEHCEGED